MNGGARHLSAEAHFFSWFHSLVFIFLEIFDFSSCRNSLFRYIIEEKGSGGSVCSLRTNLVQGGGYDEF